MHPMGYPPIFGQYPAMAAGKPGEAPTYAYQQYFLAPMPMPPQMTGQEGEQVVYPPANYIPIMAPYGPQQPYAGAMPYMVPMQMPGPRPDGQPPQIPIVPQMPYGYPQPYVKPPSRDGGSEMQPQQQVQQQMVDHSRRDPRVEAYGRMPEGIANGHGK